MRKLYDLDEGKQKEQDNWSKASRASNGHLLYFLKLMNSKNAPSIFSVRPRFFSETS